MATQNLIKMDAQGRLVLPQSIRGSSKKEKYYNCIQKKDGRIELVPVVKVITASDPQAYFWTKRWQDGEKLADEDIKQGRGNKVKAGQLQEYLKKFK